MKNRTDTAAKISTDTLIAWDREFLWHPFTPMKPWCENKDIVVIERGEREFLIDTEGRRYIDGVSSMWCNVHGHCVPELNAAVQRQLGKIAHSTLLGLGNMPSILLAKRLVELVQGCGLGLSKVFYSDNGSTAVEVACKMAYQFWGNRGTPRAKFVAFQNAYHGDTVGAVSVGGIDAFHAAFRGLCFPVDYVRWDDRTDLTGLMFALENLLKHEKYAAVIVEPLVQGAGGMRMFPEGALAGMKALCEQYDTLLIADEVMTGFGRTGRMFACEHEKVTPDLLCLSKGLTAGYMPLGVTMTTQRVFDAFYADPREGKTFFHGHTFTGHPLACAVAITSLDLFESSQLMEHVATLEPILQETMARASENPWVKSARSLGLIGAVDLHDRQTGQAFPYHWRIGGALCTRMRSLGLMMRPLGDVLVIMPPLAIREENLRLLCAGVLASLHWVQSVVEQRQREVSP